MPRMSSDCDHAAVPSCSGTSTPVTPGGSMGRGHCRLSPTSSMHSFRNRTSMEEETGSSKSGHITGFCSTVAGKPTRKSYYAILSNRCFEVHDTLKAYKKKKAARFIFDLASCFNVNRHEDAKWRSCVSLMTPDETFIFRAAEEERSKEENDRTTNEWFESMMCAVVPSRSLYLGRPVKLCEFFESAWDVLVTAHPRTRKPINFNSVLDSPDCENICAKRPELAGRRRICLNASAIYLCAMGAKPEPNFNSARGSLPFLRDTYLEISRTSVANFGYHEKYFVLRLGRTASTGLCELWAQCDSSESAANIRQRLLEIIEREGQRKRDIVKSEKNDKEDNFAEISSLRNLKLTPSAPALAPAPSPAASTTTLASTRSLRSEVPVERERVSSRKPTLIAAVPVTAPARARIAKLEVVQDEDLPACMPRQSMSIDQAILRDISRQDPLNSSTSNQQTRAHTIGSQSQSSNSWLSMLRRGASQKDKFRESISTVKMTPVSEWAINSFIATGSGEEEGSGGTLRGHDDTEDSGGTLKVVDHEDTRSTKSAVLLNGMYPHERLIESALDPYQTDLYQSYPRGSLCSTSDSSRRLTSESDSGKDDDEHDAFTRSTPDDSSSLAADDSSWSDAIGSQPFGAFSTASSCSVSHPDADKASDTSGSIGHLHVPPNTDRHHFDVDVRSYVSDSSDSCYSSNGGNFLNPHRAFSFSNNIVRNAPAAEYETMQPGKFTTYHGPRDSRFTQKHAPVEESTSSEAVQFGEEAATCVPLHKSVRIQEAIPGSMLLQPKEDLRKRAFSLGSKSWIMKPFRKLSHNQPRLAGSKSSCDSENDCSESVASHRSHPETYSSRQHSVSSFCSSAVGRSDSVDSCSSHVSGRQRTGGPQTHPPTQPGAQRLRPARTRPNDLVEVNFSPPPGNSLLAQYNAIGSRPGRGSRETVTSPERPPGRAFNFLPPEETAEVAEVAEPCPTEVQMHQVRCFISPGDEFLFNVKPKELESRRRSEMQPIKEATNSPKTERKMSVPVSARRVGKDQVRKCASQDLVEPCIMESVEPSDTPATAVVPS